MLVRVAASEPASQAAVGCPKWITACDQGGGSNEPAALIAQGIVAHVRAA
jgi:hypothetical protein